MARRWRGWLLGCGVCLVLLSTGLLLVVVPQPVLRLRLEMRPYRIAKVVIRWNGTDHVVRSRPAIRKLCDMVNGAWDWLEYGTKCYEGPVEEWHVTFISRGGRETILDLPIADGCGGFQDRRSEYCYSDDDQSFMRYCGELVGDWGDPAAWPPGIESIAGER